MQNDGVIIVNWFEKNDMVCSSEKTKLLIIGTNANRKLKLDRFNKKLRINICGELKEESESEKLLGVWVNNTLTWKDPIFGNEEESGLIKQLSKRIGILKKLRPLMSDKKFQQAVAGLFTSKLIYCITVWGGIWTQNAQYNSTSITKEAMRKLQVCQNKCLRLITGHDYNTSTKTLLEDSKQLSIHQLVAYHSVCQVYSIYRSKLPTYHYNWLFKPDQILDGNIRTRGTEKNN